MEELFGKTRCSSSSDEDVLTRHRQYQATLRETAKEEYVRANNHRTQQNLAKTVSRHSSNHMLQQRVINDIARKEFQNWKSAVRQQKHYMQTCLYMGDQEPSKFIKSLIK